MVTRLFRSDTPHDVLSASIVASTLASGRNVLAISADMSGGARDEYIGRMQDMARLSDWQAVVDISGLPVAEIAAKRPPGLTRRAAMEALIASARILRARIAPAVGIDPRSERLAVDLDQAIDELYITCLHHPDVQTLYSLLPRATKAYYPHGFDCLNGLELHYYASICSPTPVPPLDRAKDALKRLVFGDDAVPLRRMRMDAAYSFNYEAPWANRQHSLTSWLSAARMLELFERLPAEMQDYLRELAKQVGPESGLVLGSSYECFPGFPLDRELEVYATIARALVDREKVKSLLLKPHPLNGAARIEEVRARLASAVDVPVYVLMNYREFPIEILLAPFRPRAFAGFASAGIRTLWKIYEMRAYCPEVAMISLFDKNPSEKEAHQAWVRDHRDHYIAI